MDTKKFLSNVLQALENFMELYHKGAKENAFVQLGVTIADIRRFSDEECDCDDKEETQEEIDKYFGLNDRTPVLKTMSEILSKLETLKNMADKK